MYKEGVMIIILDRKIIALLMMCSCVWICSSSGMISLCFGETLQQADMQKRIEGDLRFLADDLLEGRGTPSRGLDVASVYLAYQLRSAGLQPGNDGSFFQTYPVRHFRSEKAVYNVTINGVDLDPKDFLFFPNGMDPQNQPLKHTIEFAGFGIFAPERGANYYENIDVKQKAILAFHGAPWNLSDNVRSCDRIAGKLTQVAVRGGACLVYVDEEFESPPDKPASEEVALVRSMSGIDSAFIPEFKGKPTMAFVPLMVITPKVFDKTFNKIFSGTYEEIKKSLSEQKPIEYVSNATIRIQVTASTDEGKASNVVAMIRGTDPALKDEWIVLTAHYDHLGIRDVPEGKDGILNGADDNASGTAAVLEIARQLVAGPPLRRSMLVVLTSGKEMGLLGSAYYAQHPIVPYDRVIAHINVDAIGRLNEKLFCTATGCDDLFTKVNDISRRHRIVSYQNNERGLRTVYYTESYHFVRFNVPSIEFSTGPHADHHRPGDEVAYIQFDRIPPIVRIIHQLVHDYAQGEKKPSFSKPEWFLAMEE